MPSTARIPCVDCHVGEGAAGFARAKLSGIHQLIAVTTNSYPRPIPAGAHMAPGAQAKACQNCHQPARPVGDHINVIREYADDEKNSETITVASDARGILDIVRPRDSLARRPGRPGRVRVDRRRGPDDPVRESDRCAGPRKRVPRTRHERSGDQRRHAKDDGLHRLPQHRRPSHRADARSRPSIDPSRSACSTATCRSCAAKAFGS